MIGKMSDIKAQGGLVRRNVIIQQDEHGFGLTVSGDNPVYVQSVKECSAAEKAGVQVDDQIIKVNGELVTNSNHLEVVQLIKSGSYVALTLLGKDTGGHRRSQSLGNSLPASGNQGNSDQSQQTHHPFKSSSEFNHKNDQASDVERMLNQEREYHKTVSEQYRIEPSPKLQVKLAESRTRISALEKQLQALSGNYPLKSPSTPKYRPNSQVVNRLSQSLESSSLSRSSIASRTPSIRSSSNILSSSSHEVDKSEKTEENLTASNLVSSSAPNLGNMNDIYGGSRHTPINPMEELPENSFDSMFEQARNENLMNNYYSCPADYVMSLEEDEFSDEEVLDQHGPFEKLDFLKDKIGHLAVFLHYLISNEDPTPLYFWYVTDVYSRETATTKELKKWAYEIFSTFVAQNSPLKVSIGGEAEEKVIADALNDPRTTEERLRDIFSVARMRVHDDLENILTDFRNRRTIGLGCLFGDRQLEDNMDRAAELKIVETTLMPHLDTLLGDADSSSEIQNDKNIAMASAIATLMKTAGVSPGKVSGMKGSSLEKCRCFVEKEKSSFMSLKPKRGKAYFQGHQFVGAQYSIVTFCDVCRNLLWGIGTQGFKCQGCDINVHRRNCMDNIKESCPAIHKKVKKTYPDRKTQEIDYSPRPTRTEMEDKHQDSLVADSPRPRGASMNEEYEREERKTHKKSGSRSDIDYDEMVGESEKESENRPETPIEEPPTPKAARTLGYRQKKKENWYASKAKVNYKEENGGQSPSPSNQIESPTPDSDEDSRPDSDLDIEGELPNWQTVADKKIIRKLNRKEIKRQEVIHELIHTEKTHVRNLKVLHRVFYKVIKKSNILTHEELHTIFPNLEELIERHESLSRAMKEREKESDVIENIGDIMSDRFDGDAGEQIKESCATFCRNLKNALELMKNLIQTKKDFQILMNRQEESHYCRRLKFPDIMAKTHQRLVKYPLLLENINKSTPVSHSDYKRVERCARCCKDILNHVNNEIRRVEDEIRLKELARKIEDKRSIIEDSKSGDDVEGGASVGKFDILKHKLEMEGDLVWKISPTKRVDLHVVLLNDTLVLLQKQDEKYILKTHTTTQVDNKGLNPVIRLANTLIREVATDRKAFFLVSTSLKGSQIYELVAQTYHEKKIWMDRINNATELNRAQDIFAERGRRGGILMTAPSPLVPPVEEELKGNDEQEKDIDKEKEDSEELMSDEKQSVEYSSSPVPESDSAINQELPSKERLEELQVELKQNYEDIKCLIERRSNILAEMRGEKNWEPLSESATHPRDFVVTAIGQAHHLSTPIKDILNPSSVSDQQRTTISQSISTLQKCLTDVLNAVYSNDDHRKPSVDKYDSSGKTTPQDLEGIPLKNENMDFNDSRYSPIDDSAVSVSPPPPITVSEVASLNEDTRERSSTKSNINGMMSSNESTSSSRLSSVSHEDSPQKVETGLLITSPFKMLRKRATTDPSTDTSARPQRSTRECTSSPVSVTQSDYSDSE